MNQEMEFKNIVAQYSKVAPEEMNNEMRFREDMGFSSLDFIRWLLHVEGIRPGFVRCSIRWGWYVITLSR